MKSAPIDHRAALKRGGLLVVLGLGLLAATAAQGLDLSAWTPRAPMPTGRWNPGVAVLDGQIYVIGGQSGSEATGVVEVYDPATDAWSRKADLPTPRSGLATAVADGQIYTFGGVTRQSAVGAGGSGLAHEVIEAYDPGTDTWSVKANLPVAYGEASAQVVDGRIYVTGGSSPRGGIGTTSEFFPIPRLLLYDPATDTWTAKTAVPARHSMATGAIGGKLYTAGGIGGLPPNQPFSALQRYDPVADTWSFMEPMPTARGWSAGTVWQDQLYVIGGYRSGRLLAAVEIYHPAEDVWTAGVELPDPRAGAQAAVVGGRLYLFGGSLEGGGAGASFAEVTSSVLSINLGLPPVDVTRERFEVVAGTSLTLPIDLVMDLPPGGAAPALSLDLSSVGQDAVVPLAHQGNGRYAGRPTVVSPGINGLVRLPVLIAFEGEVTEPFFFLELAVLPPVDLMVFSEDLDPAWTLTANRRVIPTPATFAGRSGLALEGSGSWRVTLRPQASIGTFGYRGLALRFHPGAFSLREGREPQLRAVTQASQLVDLLEWVDLELQAWQEVVVPLSDLGLDEAMPLDEIRLTGTLEGTFYLGDIRLVAQEPLPGATAVLAEQTAAQPQNFVLDQNYPNPFNSGTVIRFSLPRAQAVELAVYNLAGQQVIQLMDGFSSAGQYRLSWDGRDQAGRALASGVYLYRLQAGTQIETRKLVLAR